MSRPAPTLSRASYFPNLPSLAEKRRPGHVSATRVPGLRRHAGGPMRSDKQTEIDWPFSEGTDTVRSFINWILGAEVERLGLQGSATNGTGIDPLRCPARYRGARRIADIWRRFARRRNEFRQRSTRLSPAAHRESVCPEPECRRPGRTPRMPAALCRHHIRRPRRHGMHRQLSRMRGRDRRKANHSATRTLPWCFQRCGRVRAQ
jgi:hypothetical protein